MFILLIFLWVFEEQVISSGMVFFMGLFWTPLLFSVNHFTFVVKLKFAGQDILELHLLKIYFNFIFHSKFFPSLLFLLPPIEKARKTKSSTNMYSHTKHIIAFAILDHRSHQKKRRKYASICSPSILSLERTAYFIMSLLELWLAIMLIKVSVF